VRALSLRRANAVKAVLVREGIPAKRIVVVDKGESQPLSPTPDGVREPQNRRVEIVLEGPSKPSALQGLWRMDNW
jgi:OmpA-OmpF porin, OOP family